MSNSEWFWNLISNSYAKKPIENEQLFNETLGKIKKRVNVSDCIIDYGCGTGTLSIEVSGNVKEIIGIDISKNMIKIAKQKTKNRNIENIEYIKTTLFDERFKKESFDIILAFNVLHFLKDTTKVVQRINELLKPGGLLISETPCMSEKVGPSSIFIYLLSKIGIIPYIKLLKFRELENLMASKNFKIIEKKNLSDIPRDYFIIAEKV